jgi:hypothetical protein
MTIYPDFVAAQPQCGRVGEEFCQQGFIYRCEQTGSELTPIFQNRPCTVDAPSLEGTWHGEGHQSPASETGSDYPIAMTISNGGGSIDYPSLGCGGSLALISGSATSAQYRETITYGGCISGGTVSVNLFQGRLSWTWMGEYEGQQYNVIAVLER